MRTTIRELSQKGKSLQRRVAKLADDSDGVWRTVRGRRIFIGKGESFDDALKKSLGGKKSGVSRDDKKQQDVEAKHKPEDSRKWESARKPGEHKSGDPIPMDERKAFGKGLKVGDTFDHGIHGSLAGKWKVTSRDGDYLKIRNTKTGKVEDIHDSNASPAFYK